MSASKFSIRAVINRLPVLQPDAIQMANLDYNRDLRPNKVPLHIGVVKDARGQNIMLDSVRAAEKIVMQKRRHDNSYITRNHTLPYLNGAARFVFGPSKILLNRLASVDAYGGANALFLLEFFLHKFFPTHRYLISHDSWPNHENQVQFALNKKVTLYRLSDDKLNYQHTEFEKAVTASKTPFISIEQNSPHNALGIVLKKTEWDAKLKFIKKQNGIILFDSPYAGLGLSLENDLYPIRKAIELGIFTAVAFSESKIKSAYDQRIGVAFLVAPDSKTTPMLQGVLNKIERAIQSFTTKTHLTFAELYGNPELYKMWQKEFAEKIAARVRHCRKLGIEHISHTATRQILSQSRGLFATFPMSHDKAQKLWQADGIMLVKPAEKSPSFNNREIVRLNITGLGSDTQAAATLQKINAALK